MEARAGVAKALLASAESTEVGGSLGDNVVKELEGDAARGRVVDGNVKVNVADTVSSILLASWTTVLGPQRTARCRYVKEAHDMAVDAVEAKRLAKDMVGTRRWVIVGRYGTRKRVEERSGHARES